MNNLNSSIPIRQRTSNYKKCPKVPWITKSLLNSINKKNNLYYKYKKHPTVQSKSKYTRYRNILTTSLRFAKKNHFHNQFDIHKGDVKSKWKIINNVLKRKKSLKSYHKNND